MKKTDDNIIIGMAWRKDLPPSADDVPIDPYSARHPLPWTYTEKALALIILACWLFIIGGLLLLLLYSTDSLGKLLFR